MISFIQKQIKLHPKLWEIFKFLLVGGIATLIDFFFMAVTMYLLEPASYDHNLLNVFFPSVAHRQAISWYLPVVGTIVGFLFGLVFNYLLSIFFVFEKTEFAKKAQGAILFIVLAVIGLLIHVGGMYLGVDVIGANYWVIKVLLTLFVLAFNYITRKIYIFK